MILVKLSWLEYYYLCIHVLSYRLSMAKQNISRLKYGQSILEFYIK